MRDKQIYQNELVEYKNFWKRGVAYTICNNFLTSFNNWTEIDCYKDCRWKKNEAQYFRYSNEVGELYVRFKSFIFFVAIWVLLLCSSVLFFFPLFLQKRTKN